jgi:hypothetical protein
MEKVPDVDTEKLLSIRYCHSCALSLLYRGVILPLKRNISAKFLFPCRWITVGCIGLCLDLIKVPGYCLGVLFNMAGLVKKFKP